MTMLEMVCEARREDAAEAFAQYHRMPRWRWFKRGKLLEWAHLLAVEYDRLRQKSYEQNGR
jgi:hypothetical protein